MATPSLPATHRALVFHSREATPTIETVRTPSAETGACVVRVLCSAVIPYTREVYTGQRPYPLPFPLTGGASAIGRVAAVGQDATSLRPGQLVHVDCFVRGRDDPDTLFLLGCHEGDSPASAQLMRDVWRNGTLAEYVRVPLENVDPLDEARLLGSPASGGLGYRVEDLVAISGLLVPFGGLDDMAVRPGERIIIAPATGWFGGWAVMAALAMGAHVIAAGRNGVALEDVKARMGRAYGAGRVDTVQLSNDADADTAAFKALGPVDCFLEMSPPTAGKATFVAAAIRALRRNGRVSLMGGVHEDVAMPIRHVMHNNIRITGKWMYERDAIRRMVKMAEMGVLKLGGVGGVEMVGRWQLDEWEAAFKASAESSAIGRVTLLRNFTP